MNVRHAWMLLGFSALILTACGGEQAAEQPQAERRTLITVAEVQTRAVEDIEVSVGRIVSKSDPQVSAEVAGRVVSIEVEKGDVVEKGQLLARLDPKDYQLGRDRARAEIRRLEAVFQQQKRLVGRYQELAKESFFSQSALDEAKTQLEATSEQLVAARTQLEQAERNLARTNVVAPVKGKIEQRLVSQGDFVGTGSPLFLLTSDEMLRIELPFPETLSEDLAVGQVVRLSVPSDPKKMVGARITELRPVISALSRSVEVVAEIANPGGWRPGGSVTGEVIMGRREGAPVVPPVALVQRPSGTVVYQVEDGVARERVVITGVRRADFVEVTSGLQGGVTVAVDGAAFLTDGAPVRVREGG
ncbi:MAG: efflux RND transporter periplasmic adaptor subunit [Pseudomonadota bacterium]|nr:efflux RND transporter periplasmic adaptor subunit [Pseudomonadota bacterium]